MMRLLHWRLHFVDAFSSVMILITWFTAANSDLGNYIKSHYKLSFLFRITGGDHDKPYQIFNTL